MKEKEEDKLENGKKSKGLRDEKKLYEKEK